MITTRRSLITGLGALLAAPAIVRASSIMPISVWWEEVPSILPYVYVHVHSQHVYGANVFVYPTKERFAAGDLVYLAHDGYAYRHDSPYCPAPRTDLMRNHVVGYAIATRHERRVPA